MSHRLTDRQGDAATGLKQYLPRLLVIVLCTLALSGCQRFGGSASAKSPTAEPSSIPSTVVNGPAVPPTADSSTSPHGGNSLTAPPTVEPSTSSPAGNRAIAAYLRDSSTPTERCTPLAPLSETPPPISFATTSSVTFCVKTVSSKDRTVSIYRQGARVFSTTVRKNTTTTGKPWYPGPRAAGTYAVYLVEPDASPPTSTGPKAQDLLIGHLALVVRSPASPTLQLIGNDGLPVNALAELVMPRGTIVRFDLHASTATVRTATGRLRHAVAFSRDPAKGVPIVFKPGDFVDRQPGRWTVTVDGEPGSLLCLGFVESADLVRFIYTVRPSA
jgi:hypothetical protein